MICRLIMWEWRVFWRLPTDCSDFDVWKVLQIAGERKRSDVYLVATPEVGIKLRGEKELEVKVMVDRDEESGAEKWTKLDGVKYLSHTVSRGPCCQIVWHHFFCLVVNMQKDRVGRGATM